jgi:hypothetical protein
MATINAKLILRGSDVSEPVLTPASPPACASPASQLLLEALGIVVGHTRPGGLLELVESCGFRFVHAVIVTRKERAAAPVPEKSAETNPLHEQRATHPSTDPIPATIVFNAGL